jgi:tetratricopeptide (TPR) repeat protein
MNLTGKNPTFRRQQHHTNPTRVMIWMGMLIACLFLLRMVQQDQITKPFMPTPIPTRTAQSYALEGETHFIAGNLPKAIEAYRQAIQLDPQNAELAGEMTRIMVYSSATLTTDKEKQDRLDEAKQVIDQAVKIAPDSSNVHAMRALVLDWMSNPDLAKDKRDSYLAEAEQEATRAQQIDNKNPLALAFNAEILLDETRYVQAEQYINDALKLNPNLMDTHRVNGSYLETMGDYGGAINEYKKALESNPNLTFLYISIGVNYRQLKQYVLALDNFQKAVKINEQLGVKDPLPYLAIGKTYSQTGEFFAASLNVRKALQYNPYNPDVYASLGVIYFKGRNYESAIEALHCSIRGCTAEESCKVRRCQDANNPAIELQGLPLSNTTVVYYYTYGSALAGMHRPNDTRYNFCPEAVDILGQIRRGFSGDTVIMQIIEPSEQICEGFNFPRQ